MFNNGSYILSKRIQVTIVMVPSLNVACAKWVYHLVLFLYLLVEQFHLKLLTGYTSQRSVLFDLTYRNNLKEQGRDNFLATLLINTRMGALAQFYPLVDTNRR